MTQSLVTAEALRAAVTDWRRDGATIGFVPTMGALHDGHIALVKAAQRHAKRVIVSIFVNPTQFGPNEDYTRYPRQLERDEALLATADCDALFAPDVATVYPADFTTRIDPGPLATQLEGAFRPGHFSGVATVVTRLFGLVRPDYACFGEKDYQQLQIVRRTVHDLALPVEIIGVPTVRAADGLALSSRNAYLSATERTQALVLSATLRRIAAEAPAQADCSALLAAGEQAIAAAGFTLDYLTLCDAATLAPINAVTAPSRILVAAKIGKTRLIDNMAVLPAAS